MPQESAIGAFDVVAGLAQSFTAFWIALDHWMMLPVHHLTISAAASERYGARPFLRSVPLFHSRKSFST
jgi:hypothetical protein